MMRAAAVRYRSILTVGDGKGTGVGVGEPGGCCAEIAGTKIRMKTNSRRKPTCTHPPMDQWQDFRIYKI